MKLICKPSLNIVYILALMLKNVCEKLHTVIIPLSDIYHWNT